MFAIGFLGSRFCSMLICWLSWAYRSDSRGEFEGVFDLVFGYNMLICWLFPGHIEVIRGANLKVFFIFVIWVVDFTNCKLVL